jgi:hypothetical protein
MYRMNELLMDVLAFFLVCFTRLFRDLFMLSDIKVSNLGREQEQEQAPTLEPEERRTLEPEERTTLELEVRTTLEPEVRRTLGPEERRTLEPEVRQT